METERFRPFAYNELLARDKVNLDITLLKDPSPDLEAALSEFHRRSPTHWSAKAYRQPTETDEQG